MKKIILLIILLTISTNAYAGISVCYNPDNTVKEFILRGNVIPNCDYYDVGLNVTQAKYDIVRNLLQTVPVKYLKKLGAYPVEMSSSEKVAVDDALAAQLDAEFRAGSKAQFDGNNTTATPLRCLAKVILDEINVLRTRDRDRAVDVANATNLANLKTLWAARSSLNDRTLAQAKTAIQNCVDLGETDE